MLVRSALPRSRRRGATLIELSIVLAVLIVVASFYTQSEQRRLQGQVVRQAAAELQRVVDAVMAYQVQEGVWPVDFCAYDAYLAGAPADCNQDSRKDQNDVNGMLELVTSGYLSAVGDGRVEQGLSLFGSMLRVQPVHEIAPAVLSNIDPAQPMAYDYHTTAYWQTFLPGDTRLPYPSASTATAAHPGDAPGLRLSYGLLGSGGFGCYAREIAHHVVGAKVVDAADPVPTLPTSPNPSPPALPRVPSDLANCNTASLSIEVLLRRWEQPAALPAINELRFDTIHAPQVRLASASGAGVPMLLDAANSGELRLRAVVDAATQVRTTDAMIQFAKAITHPTAPLGGIVTLRGVDEGHLGIMAGYVPGGADQALPTLGSMGADHRHLSSLVFERPDGTHIGMLSADLLSYQDTALGELAFSDTAITLSAGDAARASRHAGWRARVSEVYADTQPFAPAASLAQPDSTGLRLYNVGNYAVGESASTAGG